MSTKQKIFVNTITGAPSKAGQRPLTGEDSFSSYPDREAFDCQGALDRPEYCPAGSSVRVRLLGYTKPTLAFID